MSPASWFVADSVGFNVWSGFPCHLAATEGDPETDQRAHSDHEEGHRAELVKVGKEISKARIGDKWRETPFREEPDGQRQEPADDRDIF